MNWLRNKKTVVTHSGQFHADEVFAIAILRRLSEWRNAKIIRTRDVEKIKKGDLVLDVGLEYDPERLRFDHHQTGGAGKRENGIPYAGIGLVWKRFGLDVCNGDRAMADFFEKNFIVSIDSNDNGVDISEALYEDIKQYALDDMIRVFYPMADEDYRHEDKNFYKALKIAEQIVDRELLRAKMASQALDYINSVYESADDKRILILEKSYPWRQAILKYPETLFVIVKKDIGETWGVRAVPISISGFDLRVKFPESWAGKTDGDLARISGITDAVFCHQKLFLATVKSKEGAIKMARLAIDLANKK